MGSPSDRRTGLLFGISAYALWGLLPLYWDLLKETGTAEVLSHRMVWSLPTAALLLIAMRRRAWIGELVRQPRKLGLVVLAAAVITLNWGGFIWSVAAGKVLEASLGYFINPLVSIAFGVLILRERLRPLQWVAVGIGAAAVAVMTFGYGQVPWISLMLAFSFATYGLIKNRVQLGGVEGFSAESAIQFLPALGVLICLTVTGQGSFTGEGAGHTVLLVLSGAATALPLILFGAAAVRLPLSTVGLLQYMAPAFMFFLGLFVFHEAMPPERLAGFALVWLALCLLTWDAFRHVRRSRTARAAEVAGPPVPGEAAADGPAPLAAERQAGS